MKQVVTKIGRPDLATEAMGIYQGDVYVILHPIDAWKSGRTKDDLIVAMSEALGSLPGVQFNFTQPMAMRLDEVVSGVKADVAVKVFGPDAAVLERLGGEIQTVLNEVSGAADLQVEVLSGAAQLEIVADRARMARYGINVAHLRELVETAVGGAVATEVLDGSRRFDVVVRFPDAMRGNPEAIANLLLTAPGGERVPLGNVASVAMVRGPEAINHENGERRLVVQTNVRGRDVGSFVAEAQRRLEGRVTMPEGYHITWGGQFENQQRAMQRLVLVIPLSLAIIFLLLFITFGNVRHAGLVILNVPFALVGGIGALWATEPEPEPLGIGGVHRPLRRGRAERRRDDCRDQPAEGGRPVDPRRRHRRRRHAAQAGPDDRAGGLPRLHPDGDFLRRRVGDSAAAGHAWSSAAS